MFLHPSGISMGEGHHSSQTCYSGISEDSLQDLSQFLVLLSAPPGFSLSQFASIFWNFYTRIHSLQRLLGIICHPFLPFVPFSKFHQIAIILSCLGSCVAYQSTPILDPLPGEFLMFLLYTIFLNLVIF